MKNIFNKLILAHIRDGTMPPKGLADYERYLDLSVKEALRCGDIVKTLLTFARQKKIEAGHIEVLLEEIELAEIIEDVAIVAEGLLLNILPAPVALRLKDCTLALRNSEADCIFVGAAAE